MTRTQFIPFIIFTAIILLLAIVILYRSGNRADFPTMQGQEIPRFTLPVLRADGGTITKDALTGGNTPALVNFFASWCLPCHKEHAILMDIAARYDVTMIGIAYQDKPAATRTFLDKRGNPYDAVGLDNQGDAAIAWGVSGVPETYLITSEGIIMMHVRGPLTNPAARDALNKKLSHALGHEMKGKATP